MAVIPTGGFARATVMPDAGLLDPRLFATDYSAGLRGLGQGMELANSYANQRQLALDRADANSLRELRLAAQRGQLALEPQLQQNALALSNRSALEARVRPIELESTRSVTKQGRYGEPTSGFTPSATPEDIEAGIIGTYEVKQNRLPGEDVVVQEDRLVLDPETMTRRNVRNVSNVLQTSEQIANTEADNARALKAAEAKAAADAAELARRTALEKEQLKIAQENLKIAQDREKRLSSSPSGFVTKDGQFDRRAAQNAADVNKHLLLGNLADVSRFSQTPQGRAIVLKVQRGLTEQQVPRLTPEDEAFIEQFRNDTASVDVALPVSATASDSSVVPQAISAQDQQALKWAKANPQDPRAAAIRQRLGQ